MSIATLAALVAFCICSSASSAAKFDVISPLCASIQCGMAPRGLVADGNGNFFGTTLFGGAQNKGVIFEVSPRNSGRGYSYRVLYSFCSRPACLDGYQALSAMVVDTLGNLYGTTESGGIENGGTVFELRRTGRKLTFRILHSFCSTTRTCVDGAGPSGLSYRGAAENAPYDGISSLYGVTEYGGLNGPGVAYELTPNPGNAPWTEKVLYNFCSRPHCSDGRIPAHGVLADSNGDLWGVTLQGGSSDHGYCFAYLPDSRSGTRPSSICFVPSRTAQTAKIRLRH